MSIITMPKMDRVILSNDAKVTLNEEVSPLGANRVFFDCQHNPFSKDNSR